MLILIPVFWYLWLDNFAMRLCSRFLWKWIPSSLSCLTFLPVKLASSPPPTLFSPSSSSSLLLFLTARCMQSLRLWWLLKHMFAPGGRAWLTGDNGVHMDKKKLFKKPRIDKLGVRKMRRAWRFSQWDVVFCCFRLVVQNCLWLRFLWFTCLFTKCGTLSLNYSTVY